MRKILSRIQSVLHIIKRKIGSMIMKIKDFFKTIKDNSMLMKQVQFLDGVRESQYKEIKKLEEKCESLQRGQELLHERLYEVESFMESAKIMVKEKVQNSDINKKKKWLHGYPDETKK